MEARPDACSVRPANLIQGRKAMADFLATLGPLIYPLAAIAYILLMNRAAKRLNQNRPLTEPEYLTRMARTQGRSEYDLFCDCGNNWRFSRQKVEDDFKSYLLRGQIPHYVRDCIRKYKKEHGEEKASDLAENGLPHNWMA